MAERQERNKRQVNLGEEGCMKALQVLCGWLANTRCVPVRRQRLRLGSCRSLEDGACDMMCPELQWSANTTVTATLMDFRVVKKWVTESRLGGGKGKKDS